VKILDLLKGGMALAGSWAVVWGKKSSICSIQDKEHEIKSSFGEQYQHKQ
jgi:hypothetical protein